MQDAKVAPRQTNEKWLEKFYKYKTSINQRFIKKD